MVVSTVWSMDDYLCGMPYIHGAAYNHVIWRMSSGLACLSHFFLCWEAVACVTKAEIV